MKLVARVFGIFLFLSQFPASGYWYVLHTTDFNHLEQLNTSTTITLALRFDAPSPYYINRADVVSSSKCTQVNMTPPVGKEMQWFSLLTTAVSTGQDLVISGDIDSVNQFLVVDAVHGIGRLSLGH